MFSSCFAGLSRKNANLPNKKNGSQYLYNFIPSLLCGVWWLELSWWQGDPDPSEMAWHLHGCQVLFLKFCVLVQEISEPQEIEHILHNVQLSWQGQRCPETVIAWWLRFCGKSRGFRTFHKELMLKFGKHLAQLSRFGDLRLRAAFWVNWVDCSFPRARCLLETWVFSCFNFCHNSTLHYTTTLPPLPPPLPPALHALWLQVCASLCSSCNLQGKQDVSLDSNGWGLYFAAIYIYIYVHIMSYRLLEQLNCLLLQDATWTAARK